MNLPELDINLAQRINHELMLSRRKYPGNANMTAALLAEAGELAGALLKSDSRENIEEEALQVIAVTLRILLEGDSSIPRVEPVKEG